MIMDKETIKKINQEVYAQFPEMAGHSPKVKRKNIPGAKSIGSKQTYSLTYDSTARTAEGRRFLRRVNVVANQKGKILKLTTSR
jgi:hypothetical protein